MLRRFTNLGQEIEIFYRYCAACNNELFTDFISHALSAFISLLALHRQFFLFGKTNEQRSQMARLYSKQYYVCSNEQSQVSVYAGENLIVKYNLHALDDTIHIFSMFYVQFDE